MVTQSSHFCWEVQQAETAGGRSAKVGIGSSAGTLDSLPFRPL